MHEQVRSNRRRLVLHLLAAATCFGTIEGLIGMPDPTPIPLDLVEVFVINLVFFYWFVVDSEIRNYKASSFLKFLVVALGIIPLAWYAVRTRGFQGSIQTFLCALGLILLDGAVFRVTSLLTSTLVDRSSTLLGKLL